MPITIFAVVLAILVSETTSNTASAAVVVPIIIPIAQAAGVDPLVPALAATFAASFGFMLPVSTPQNAIVYGSGVVPITKMIRSGISFDVLGAVLILHLPADHGGGRRDRLVTPQRIAVIPGDGIGVEVTAAARRVLDAVAARHGLDLAYDDFDWSCQRWLDEGAMMPADGIERLRPYDAILLGAVGWPGVPDHESLWGLLIPIRRSFRQYVNLRPVRVFEGVGSPLREPSRAPSTWRGPGERRGRVQRDRRPAHRGFPDEMAVQEAVFTRAGVTRIVDHAFELAAHPAGPADLGHQVQRDRAHDALLGRDRPGAGRAAHPGR